MDDLVALFKSDELAWLADRLAARLEGGKPLDTGTVTLANATPAQRRAIDSLFGRRSTTGHTLRVSLSSLARQLHLDAHGLHALLETVCGPLRNRRAHREAESAGWAALFSRWRARLSGDAGALHWLDSLERGGMLKRHASRDLEAAEALLRQSRAVLDSAPYDDLLLASLAARVTGDSHALDRGRPLAALCLRAIAVSKGLHGTASADSRREAWAAIGVSIDDLSAPVLCLNLRAETGSDTAAWIDWHVARGEPFYLPWRQVREFHPDPAMAAVYVCENPAVVSEAANRLGPRCRPLICLNGIPSSPVKALLRRLADRSVSLHLRADFDWTGLRIVDQICARHSTATRFWRMTAADYRSCRATQKLTGSPFRPGWATELVDAMEHSGLAAYEEELIDALIDDLHLSTPGTSPANP